MKYDDTFSFKDETKHWKTSILFEIKFGRVILYLKENEFHLTY